MPRIARLIVKQEEAVYHVMSIARSSEKGSALDIGQIEYLT